MTYAVKEIYYTLQGEGAQTGRPAVFCRFSRCNLWNGHKDRIGAICTFCDTDFVGTDGPNGGIYRSATELTQRIIACFEPVLGPRYVVLTGGEPLLQVDADLIDKLHGAQFEIGLETNGTIEVPIGIDWVCVSPKAGAPLVVTAGNELKLVFPQPGLDPASLEHLAFDYFYLQPMDGPKRSENTRAAVNYCLAHPRWRLSLQSHKYIGIP
jgi:7-carboxy-7-deazaguanine synthase (Cx14CxxC type)